jgi:hypothetical protein
MHRLFFKGHIPLIVSVCLATISLPPLRAEPHCPGNVASLRLHPVNRHLFILDLSINHSGPYNFLLDSGTQITMIEPSLAAELHLATRSTVTFFATGSLQSASLAKLDLVEAGSHAVAQEEVLVYELQSLRSAGLPVRGVLGEDFLGHFDMLIDNGHSLLCLDNSAAMRAAVKGPHIPLLAPAEVADGASLPPLLIIAARLSDGNRPVRLVLDSASTWAVLFDTTQYMSVRPSYDVPLSASGVDGTQQILAALPPQDVRIGSVELPGVPFFSLSGIQKDARLNGVDGVLATWLFRRVFIVHADHFAVLEPR